MVHVSVPIPRVGDRYYIACGKGTRSTPYHVRAIVDHDDSGPTEVYQVVLRHWSPAKGWRYVVESEAAFTVGLYSHERRDPVTGERRHPQVCRARPLASGGPVTRPRATLPVRDERAREAIPATLPESP